MSKRMNKITAVISLTFIAVFGSITMFSHKLPDSFSEDRELAVLPCIDAEGLYSGSVTAELGSYVADHFAGRHLWVAAKTALQTELSESIVNGVYISDDRMLYVESAQRSSEEVMDDAAAVNSFSVKYDGTVYFAAIPTSAGVYGDVLPSHMIINSEKQQINDLYDALGNDIRKIDAYDILKMMKDNYIFYRNDTKWTCYGAYCVYKTVVQKLGFQPTLYDKFSIEHVTDRFRGNLYNKTLSKRTKADILDIYRYKDAADDVVCECIGNDGKVSKGTVFDRSRLDTSNMYSMYLGEAAPVMKIKTSVNNEKKLLVIKDSYADCFVPFLMQHYSEIAVVSPEKLDRPLTEELDINEYGQTLFLFGIEDLSSRSDLTKIIERN